MVLRGRSGVMVAVLLVLAGGLYGVLVEREHLFPFELLRPAPPAWSIGIYEGPSPFVLGQPPHLTNPVLTRNDVTDLKAEAVADPFVVVKDSTFFMFFEVVEAENRQGAIALATSANGTAWRYDRVVIDEDFHLSYPYVFEWNGEHYLVPESHEDLSVRLYRATTFPSAWEYQGDLIRGYHFADPSVVRYHERWWLFVGTRENDALNLYYADSLAGPWVQHPLSPVVKGDRNRARPAGRLLVLGDTLFRFAQDDDPTYGSAVSAYRILELSPTAYREEIVAGQPVVGASGTGWNTKGMHQVDPFLQRNGRWWAAVDGLR